MPDKFIPYSQYIHQHDEKIRDEYAERRTADLADEVQRNYYTVSRKAKRLGVQKTDEFMRSSWAKGGKPMAVKGEARKRWKVSADAYMREHFADIANEQLAQTLDVDVKTVRRWARRLGLQKSEAFMQRARAKGCCTTGPRPFYTPEQEAWRRQRLAEVYPDGNMEELQALAGELGIKVRSVRSEARKYGIHRSEDKRQEARANFGKNNLKYGPDFIAALAEYYPTHTTKDCAEHFGLPTYTIAILASRNGIKKTRERRAQSQRERWKKEENN